MQTGNYSFRKTGGQNEFGATQIRKIKYWRNERTLQILYLKLLTFLWKSD